jgi:hypothetical protein
MKMSNLKLYGQIVRKLKIAITLDKNTERKWKLGMETRKFVHTVHDSQILF